MGWTSVEEGLRNISSRELTEWQLFEKIEGPIDARRTDYNFARLYALIVNIMKKKEDAPVDPIDFMIWMDEAAKKDLKASVEDDDEAFERNFANVHGDM